MKRQMKAAVHEWWAVRTESVRGERDAVGKLYYPD